VGGGRGFLGGGGRLGLRSVGSVVGGRPKIRAICVDDRTLCDTPSSSLLSL
jgi:hypothetical protein